MSFSFSGWILDLDQITLTTCASSRILSASSSDVLAFGISSGLVIRSTDSPRQPFLGVKDELGEGELLFLSAALGESDVATRRR